MVTFGFGIILVFVKLHPRYYQSEAPSLSGLTPSNFIVTCTSQDGLLLLIGRSAQLFLKIHLFFFFVVFVLRGGGEGESYSGPSEKNVLNAT